MGLPHYDPPLDDEISAPLLGGRRRGRARPAAVLVGCGRWQWYPDEAGPDCPGASLVWEPVATTGTLHTTTRVERAFLPGGQADVPYVVAFVELDGVEGVRLVANLADDSEVAIGDRVQAEFVDLGPRAATSCSWRSDRFCAGFRTAERAQTSSEPEALLLDRDCVFGAGAHGGPGGVLEAGSDFHRAALDRDEALVVALQQLGR